MPVRVPGKSGEVIVQGADLGAWTITQRIEWDKLMPTQQWLLDSVLGLETAGEGELQPVWKRQADRWAATSPRPGSSIPARAICASRACTCKRR
ncbi:hypothetical protein [Streptomyces sp. NPDC055056]